MPKKYDLRFMHIADVHLGKRQYGLDQRADDFATTFKWVCDEAIKNRVYFVLIAGDLFDNRNVNAKTLEQAVIPLGRLELHEIPVYVIEGNHDRPYYKDKMGWIEYLSERCLVKHINKNEIIYENDEIAIINLTDAEIPVELNKFTIGMLHAGIEGVVPNMTGCISKEDINKMKGSIDYLALGHIHRPYKMDGWIYNPGSLEHWNISEASWNGGYYLVDVDTKSKKFNAKHVISPKRTMVRFEFDANTYWGITECNGAVVEITLIGETKEKANIDKIRENVSIDNPGILYLKIVDKTTRPNSKPIEITTKDKKDIERDTINDMTKDEKLTNLILEIKKFIDDETEDLLELINND